VAMTVKALVPFAPLLAVAVLGAPSDQQVAAVAARAVEGVADDVRRLEGPIQSRVTGEAQAGRQSHDLIGIAVQQRETLEEFQIHGEPQARISRVQRAGPQR